MCVVVVGVLLLLVILLSAPSTCPFAAASTFPSADEEESCRGNGMAQWCHASNSPNIVHFPTDALLASSDLIEEPQLRHAFLSLRAKIEAEGQPVIIRIHPECESATPHQRVCKMDHQRLMRRLSIEAIARDQANLAVPTKYKTGSPRFLYRNDDKPLDDPQRHGLHDFLGEMQQRQQHHSHNQRQQDQDRYGRDFSSSGEVLATLETIVDDSKWNANTFRYASGPIEHMADEKLQYQLRNSLEHIFQVHSASIADEEEGDDGLQEKSASPDVSRPNINMWVGNDGVTALLHYDTSHNYYLMVQGTKTFHISPLASLLTYHWYPSISPLYRQAPIHEDLSMSSVAYTLHPGDTLYLPPYWPHQVVSHGWSLAYNVWSNSATFAAMDKCFLLPLPFEGTWPRMKLQSVALAYLQLLGEQLFLPPDEEFVHGKKTSQEPAGACDSMDRNAGEWAKAGVESLFLEVYNDRYSPHEATFDRCATFSCPDSSTYASGLLEEGVKQESKWVGKFHAYLTQHTRCFSNTHRQRSSSPTLDTEAKVLLHLYFANFVEYVLLLVGGDSFVSLLRCCAAKQRYYIIP